MKTLNTSGLIERIVKQPIDEVQSLRNATPVGRNSIPLPKDARINLTKSKSTKVLDVDKVANSSGDPEVNFKRTLSLVQITQSNN